MEELAALVEVKQQILCVVSGSRTHPVQTHWDFGETSDWGIPVVRLHGLNEWMISAVSRLAGRLMTSLQRGGAAL